VYTVLRSELDRPSARATPAARIGRRLLWPLAALVAGWTAALVANAMSLDVWLLPLILVGTASLLRSGRTLLDRLLVALLLLAGTTIAAAVGLSRWPWHLEPLPLALLAVGVLAGAMLITGRVPQLPRPTWWDALPLGAGLTVAVISAVPYLRTSGPVGTLAAVMVGQDPSRHMSTVDGIRRAGGYAFLNWTRGIPVTPPDMRYYPQGWHMVSAIVDNFVRSSPTALGGPLSLPSHFAIYSLAGMGLLATVLAWAALRIAAPALNLARGTLLTLVVVSQVIGTELVRLFALGYPAETMALTMAVALVAVLSRPLQRPREQLLLISALVIGIGFAYYLFLPPVVLMVLWWCWVRRRAVRRTPVTFALCVLATALLAPLPAVLGYVRADQTTALTYGADWQTPPYLTLGVLGFAIVAAIVAFGWHSRALRRYLACLLVAAAFAGALAVNSLLKHVTPGYYFGKAIHFAFVVGIAGLGTVALYAGVPKRAARSRVPLARRWVPAVLAVALLVVTIGVPPGRVSERLSWTPQEGRSWIAVFAAGDWTKNREAKLIAAADAQYPAVPGTNTLIVDSTDPLTYVDSTFLSALQGTSGATAPYIYGRSGATTAQRLLKTLTVTRQPIRLIMVDPAAYAALDEVLKAHPELKAKVIVAPLAGVFPPAGRN
jgi:hypothetical protein